MKKAKAAETGSSWSDKEKIRADSFSIAGFIRRKPFLRKIMPGIRFKLSFLFGILLSVILAAATLFNYLNQSHIIEEGFQSEIETSLKYINSVSVSMDSVRTNLLLIEEMKIRIKEKQEDLKKYRTYVYRKKDSLANTFKNLGKKLGIKANYDYYRKGYDTYFSTYISEKQITDLEKKVAEQLKHKDGKPVTSAEMKDIEARCRSVIYYQRRIDAAESEIEAVRENSSASSSKKNQLLENRLKKEKTGKSYADRRLRNSLKLFYEYSFNSLENTGLSNSNIRIITYGADGEINYDTGVLIRDGITKFAPLLKHSAFIADRNNFFSAPDQVTLAEIREYNYSINGKYYHVNYRPVFKNPATYERIIAIRKDFEENSSGWLPFLREDTRISGLIAAQCAKLRERLAILKQSKTVPGSDSEYKMLYEGYKKLLKERSSVYSKLAPYSDEAGIMNEYYKDQANMLNAEIAAAENRIKELRNDKTGSSEDIKNEIEIQQSLIEENSRRMAKLKQDMKKSKEDIWQSGKLTAHDAVQFIREAALLDFAILKPKINPLAYRDYLRSSKERAIETGRFDTLRDWIMAAGSETALPSDVRGMKNTPLAGDGILAFSRSEIEEYMWFLDSTPIAGETGILSVETEGGLLSDLMENSITGFNAVLVDKTDGVNRIIRNRNLMIFYSSLIALFSMGLVYLLAGFTVRRIRGIISKAALAGYGELNVDFPEKGLDEIEVLGSSLNTMMKGLREKEQLKGEIAAAGEIQKILLPETIPSNLENYYTIGTFYRSMQGVGGDYYDLIELDENRIFFCIGDVSSHGVGPAIVMSMLRAHLHGIIQRGTRELTGILCELNRQIFQDTPSHIYVTLFVGIIDRASNEIEYCSAGHPRAMVYRYKKDDIEILPEGGLPVGMDDNDFFAGTLSVKSIKLAPGDLFFQYTDGASEAMDASRNFFGEDGIRSELKKYARKKPDAMITRIAEAIENFTGKKIIDTMISELNDDIAMIVFKRIK
jgi:serine phosphatase RsbU (regulator of sigma subunit)